MRERVKDILKRYGVTVTSVLVAAGVTIGAVIKVITNSLKTTGKALGNGLKENGKKIASILPGLVGAIISYLFRTAGHPPAERKERQTRNCNRANNDSCFVYIV